MPSQVRQDVSAQSPLALKIRFPEEQRIILQPAIDILRSRKTEALAMLAKVASTEQKLTPAVAAGRQGECEPLESALKDCAVELDSAGYAGHSLRAGHATSAAIAGASERSIMNQTGHRSVQMVRRSIRDGSLFRENSAAKPGL